MSVSDDWERTTTERFGELGIRALLSTRIDGETAERAASGWGNDRLLAIENESAVGVVRTTSWDRASDGEQFATGVEADASAGDPPQEVTLTRPAADTVVVMAGSQSFVDGVSMTGDTESVSVSLPE